MVKDKDFPLSFQNSGKYEIVGDKLGLKWPPGSDSMSLALYGWYNVYERHKKAVAEQF